MHKISKSYSALLVLFISLFSNSASAIEYDEIFPLYVDACALTQIKKQDQHDGNPWGHSILYVKGLCKDNSLPYPTVKVCDEDVDLSRPQSGTMLSSVRAINNTNWVATPGYLAFDGDYSPGQPIDEIAYEHAKKEMIEAQVFNGVQMRSKFLKEKPLLYTKEEYMIETSLGTDYAVSWGRTALCHRIPITRTQLELLAQHYNHLNDPYRDSKVKFQWHTFNNNCAHLVRNGLAAIGIMKPQAIGRPFHHWFGDFLTPIGEFTKLKKSIKKFHIPHVQEAYQHEKIRDHFLANGHLRFPHGMIVIKKDIMPDNLLFERKLTTSFLVPFSKEKKKVLKKQLKKDRFTDLLENLKHFESEYERALQVSIEIVNHFNHPGKQTDQGFLSFSQKYMNFLQSSIFDVKSKIELIERN